MVPDIRLLITDLDGTLIGRANELPLYATFKQIVDGLRRDQGARWVACTGRSRASFDEFFTPMRAMGLMPEYVVIRHAHIYRLTRLGYIPSPFWSLHIYHLLWRQQVLARELLSRWREIIRGAAVGVRLVEKDKDELRLQCDSQESAQVASELLKEKLASCKHLRVFVHFREVEVKPVPFTKGLAVSELCRHLGLGPEHVLAIGNGYNDISMLAPEVARHTGCPANSESEVIEVVHQAGGHVATVPSLSGVIEILKAQLEGQVCSDLPAGWLPPAAGGYRPRHRPAKRMKHRHEMYRMGAWLAVGVTYVVLLVFAYFGLIPFGSILLKPVTWVFDLVERIVRFYYVH